MKYIILFLLMLSSSQCFAQDYGVKLIQNFASHTNYNPQIPEDGEFLWNSLSGIGIEVFYNKIISERLKTTHSIAYQPKGYKEIVQTGFIGTGRIPVSNNVIRNRINTMSISTDISYAIKINNKIGLLPYMGFEFNLITSRDLESERIDPIKIFYPVVKYQNNWNTTYLNMILGTRLEINKLFTIETGFSRSLTPLLNVNDLVVKEWNWIVKMGVSLQRALNKN